MGLRFKDSEVSFSYTGFHEFRCRLAKQIGFDLNQMAGFDGNSQWVTVKDPLKPFLNHSDCFGSIAPQVLGRIAPRLRELVADWPPDDDKKQALDLARDMQRLSKAGKRLVFQ